MLHALISRTLTQSPALADPMHALRVMNTDSPLIMQRGAESNMAKQSRLRMHLFQMEQILAGGG